MFISFLGIGQGGSNIADLASKRGFYSAAINFSQSDLHSLEHIDEKLKLRLVGSEGVGKQRNEAISLMENNYDLTLNFVKENFSHTSIEIIFVPFATGGGSGSGIAPVLLQLLTESMSDKVFVAMPIIPSHNESFISQKNCLETFEDLSHLDICTLPIDNAQTKSTLSHNGKNHLYNKVNQSVIHLIEQVLSYTDKHSKYGVLDKKDLRVIFSMKGMCTIAESNLMDLSNRLDLRESTITQAIMKSWETSIFAKIEYDQVLSSGFIFDGQEMLMDYIQLEQIYSQFGNKMPISLFEGYYTKEKGGKVITILSGLSWCNSRLKEIDELVMETNKTFQNLHQSPVYQSKLSDISLPLNKPREVKKVSDISNIINKFKR